MAQVIRLVSRLQDLDDVNDASLASGGYTYWDAASGALIARALPTQTPDTWSTLTDADPLLTDASLANRFMVTLGGDRTLAAPTNGTDGQRLTWLFQQDATGGRQLTLDTAFLLSDQVPSLVLSTAPDYRDLLEAVYVEALGNWILTRLITGIHANTDLNLNFSSAPNSQYFFFLP